MWRDNVLAAAQTRLAPETFKREATMSEEKLVDIEVKLAHQDQLLIELNDVITKHTEKIMKLEELCGLLTDRVRSISDAMPDGASLDERPPHY